MDELSNATLMRVRAEDSAAAFTKACSEQESEIKDQIDGLAGLFQSALSEHEPGKLLYALDNGGYLYMRTITSVRLLNEERISKAVQLIDAEQLEEVRVAMREQLDRPPTFAEVVVACVHENLEDECTSTSYAPTVTQRRPKAIDPALPSRPAPRAVSRAATNYTALKKQLTALRKHRSKGQKRVADVAALTEPVIHKYMKQKELTKQRVRLIDGAAVAAEEASAVDAPVAAVELPPMPALLPDHAREDAEDAPAPKRVAAAEITMDAGAGAAEVGRTIEIKRRTYTSRGKAPRIETFIDGLPEQIAKSHRKYSKGAPKQPDLGQEEKKAILAVLLERFRTMHDAAKGKVTEKLLVKSLVPK